MNINKTLVIGDIHGDDCWKKIIEKENHNRIIFVGDYFDSFNITTEKQINNFLDIIEYKKTSGKEVIMLVGNHDYHYFFEEDSYTSGYQNVGKYQIKPIINETKQYLQMAYQMDNILFTHAGVTEEYLKRSNWTEEINIVEHLNELFKYKPLCFGFAYYIPHTEYCEVHGDDIRQSPIWVRPKSLMKHNQYLKKKIIQVVGHTKQNQIDIKGKSTGGRYYFIDTLRTSGEYLIIENGNITCNKMEI